jgi:hypothetical protein
VIIAHERPLVYGDLLKCVYGVAFFGVPHRGSEVAYWGNFAANLLKMPLLGNTNTKFVAALQKNSETFANISQQFIEHGSSLQIRTFYETKKAYNQLVWDRFKSCPSDADCTRLSTKIQRALVFQMRLQSLSRIPTTKICANLGILKAKSMHQWRDP